MDSNCPPKSGMLNKSKQIVLDETEQICNSNSPFSIENTSLSNNSSSNIATNATKTNPKKKWKCSHCTYENWPSALKCTICLCTKTTNSSANTSTTLSNHDPSSMIRAKHVNKTKTKKNRLMNSSKSLHNFKAKLNPSSPTKESTIAADNAHSIKDIYHLANLSIGSTNEANTAQTVRIEEPVSSESGESAPKWSCSVCTYLNWPKSLKCVQCYTIRTAVSESSHDTAGNASKTSTPVSRSLCNSPCTIPKKETPVLSSTKLGLSSTSANIDAQSIELISLNETNPALNDNSKKWSCSACTYQNWPKSQRCVMCHVPRTNNTPTNNTPTQTNPSTNKKLASNPTAKQQLAKPNQLISANKLNEQQIQLKNQQLKMDCLFLTACQGIVEGDLSHLDRYVNSGGDLTRFINADEVKLLNRPNVFSVGLTLLHLCYQFNHKEFLIKILNKTATNKFTNGPKVYANTNSLAIGKKVNTTKYSPCQSSPSLAITIIDRFFLASLRQRKSNSSSNSGIGNSTNSSRYYDVSLMGAANNSAISNQNSSSISPTSSLMSLNSSAQGLFSLSPSPSPPPQLCSGATSSIHHHGSSLCYYVNESHTFTLPNEIEDFSLRVQHILFDELLDREVQQELEIENRIINWNVDLCKRLNSKLYPLWNRHSGDCLLDSVFQACYGVFDTNNILRRIMAESLEQYSNL